MIDTERQTSSHADTQGCAVYQSLTLLPHCESAFPTINPVPYNARLVSAALLSLLHEEVKENVLLSILKSP